MNTKKLLLLAALSSPLLLAFNLPGSRVRFAPADGSSVAKTFENKVELTLDHMAVSRNGQDMSGMMPEMDMNMTSEQKVVVTDEYVSNRDGAPKKLRRRFDELGNDTSFTVKMSMNDQTQDNSNSVKAKSELAGKTVVFTWDDESKDYKKAFDPAEDSPELLKDLHEDMDLRALLPEGEVKEGDEWDVDVKRLAGVIAPGGNLSLVPESIEEAAGGMGGMGGPMGSMSDWLSDLLEGEAKAKFAGMREVDGGKFAVIKLTVKIQSSKDMSDMVAEAMKKAKIPEEAGKPEIDHMDIDFKLEGEGELLWDVGSGRLHSFEMSGPTHINMDMGMKLNMPQMEMKLDISMEMSGTANISAKAE